jgi:circadian clock protein KaiB
MYELKLYVIGKTPNSIRAQNQMQVLLEKAVPGQYTLQVIDILSHQKGAEADDIIATPTVLKIAPPPSNRIIGDLSADEKVLSGLGITATEE